MTTSFRFQPLVRLSDNKIAAYETLSVNVCNQQYPSAACILQDVCSVIQHNSELSLCINMTVEDVVSKKFYRNVIKVIEKMGLDPSRIVLEVSESTPPESLNEAKYNLRLLRNYGLKIALDDFGSKNASFKYMTELPLDIIKLDCDLLREAKTNSNYRSIIRCITHVAHDIGCSVVAEGIETIGQLQYAQETGIEFGQGFLFATKISEAEEKRFTSCQDLDNCYSHIPALRPAFGY